jgi:hypothetical protein
VHLRRALLLFALVLGLTALAATIAPSPRDRQDTTPQAQQPAPTTTPVEAGERELSFQFPTPAKGGAPDRRVTPDEHVVVVVAVDAPGQVQIPALGRTVSVTATSPAELDLLAPPAGRYDVLFTNTVGESTRVGTIVSR